MIGGPIAVLGPTGAGKTDFALRLAAELPVEIVSVDSAQVYRGLDIGTAKPALAERARVPHHLIDIRDPEEVYSAGEFRSDCVTLLERIRGRGRTPLLVGGTMLYYRALFRGIAPLPTADAGVREDLDARAMREGWPALHLELQKRDPESAARIHPHDSQRIQRALEVLELSGKPLGEHWQQPQDDIRFADWEIVILEPADRPELHARLARRLQVMVDSGLVAEVNALVARPGVSASSPAMRLVGYRQFVEHCRGQESQERATERALYATRQLAKRQMTWLRSANLLPDGATSHRIDAFDERTRERLTRTLIKSRKSP